MLSFPVVIIAEPTKGEKYFGYFLVFAWITSSICIFFTRELIYLWIPIVITIIFIIYNFFKGKKFSLSTWIQKNKHILFTEKGIIITNDSHEEFYEWDKLDNIICAIIGYNDAAQTNDINNDSYYSGTENHVSFTYENTNHQIYFYIKKEAQYNELLSLAKNLGVKIHYR